MSEWIRVKNIMPEDDLDVLLCTKSKDVLYGCFRKQHNVWVAANNYCHIPDIFEKNDITHWQRLPMAPKDE